MSELKRLVCDICEKEMMPGRLCVSCVLWIHGTKAPRFSAEEREALEVAAGWCALKASMGSPTQWTTGHKTAAVIGKMLEAE